MELAHKTIIIAGGGGLIGSEFTRAAAEAGADVILADFDPLAEKTAQRINAACKNGSVTYLHLDITSPDSVAELFASVKKTHSAIHGVVNAAYPKNKRYGAKFEEVTYADFCENLRMHVGGYFLMCQHAARIMQKQAHGGTIVNIGSTYGFRAPRFDIYADTNMTSPVEYAAIKGGVINLTTYLASYLGTHNIRVNAISPGGVFDNQPASFVAAYEQRVVLGHRMAKPNDLSGALVFLLSDAAAYMTGQNIIIDGGWTI